MGVLTAGNMLGSGSRFVSLSATAATPQQQLDDAICVVPLFKLLSMLSSLDPAEATQWRDDIGNLLTGAGFTDDQINQGIEAPPPDPDTVEILPADKPLAWSGLTIAVGVKQE